MQTQKTKFQRKRAPLNIYTLPFKKANTRNNTIQTLQDNVKTNAKQTHTQNRLERNAQAKTTHRTKQMQTRQCEDKHDKTNKHNRLVRNTTQTTNECKQTSNTQKYEHPKKENAPQQKT